VPAPARNAGPGPAPDLHQRPQPAGDPRYGGPGDGGPPYGPDGREGPGGRPPKARRKRKVTPLRVLAVLGILVIMGLVGTFLYANSVFNRIERVETEDTLSSGGSGTNYLMVGSDSREVVAEGEAGISDGDFPGGQRSDTMVILHVEGDDSRILSVPRDLYVEIAGTGESGKINAAFNGGAPRLIDTIEQALDIPIHRYVEVDFASFGGIVDALGGVTINFPNPATDANSGLNVTQSGPVELDGEQALAYVRSRNYVEHINGEQVTDPTGDLGRILRQQQFLRAVLAKVSETKNPFALAGLAGSVADGIRIDDEMGMTQAFRLLWTMRGGLEPTPLELPVTPDRNDSGAVLLLQEEEAQDELDQVR
jgi:LCP family protein required for cell wall assembly